MPAPQARLGPLVKADAVIVDLELVGSGARAEHDGHVRGLRVSLDVGEKLGRSTQKNPVVGTRQRLAEIELEHVPSPCT